MTNSRTHLVEHHNPGYDSTPVILHARRLCFIMVLTSALIVTGIFLAMIIAFETPQKKWES